MPKGRPLKGASTDQIRNNLSMKTVMIMDYNSLNRIGDPESIKTKLTVRSLVDIIIIKRDTLLHLMGCNERTQHHFHDIPTKHERMTQPKLSTIL